MSILGKVWTSCRDLGTVRWVKVWR